MSHLASEAQREQAGREEVPRLFRVPYPQRLRLRRRYVVALAVAVLLSFLGLLAFRGVIRVKGMVDNGSLGSDYLQSAYRDGIPRSINKDMLEAAEQFTALDQSLEHWSWFVAVSNLVPPARRQFSAMESIAQAGSQLVFVEVAPQARGADTERGSLRSVCRARDDLEAVDGVYFQLQKTAAQLHELTGHFACGDAD